jgi:hypothetical protein
MNYGYARVSTDRQSVEAQVRQLRAAVVGKVFRELASGAKTEHAQPSRSLWRATAIGRALYVKVQSLPWMSANRRRVSSSQAVNGRFQRMGIASPINREWLETTRNSPVQKSKIRTKIRALAVLISAVRLVAQRVEVYRSPMGADALRGRGVNS